MKLGVSILVGLATAAFLAYAGNILRGRRVEATDRLAAQAFSGWWYAASLVILNQTLRTLLALGGVTDMAVYTALLYIGNLFLAAALGCLLYYILFLLTGRRGLLGIVLVLYGLYFVYLNWYTARGGARRLIIGDWQAQLTSEFTPPPAESIMFGILLAAPILVTLTAYTILFFRVPGRSQRYRLFMVSGGFFLLFGIILLGFLFQWNQQPWFSLVYQIPALMTSVLAVWAYHPPKWIQRRLNVRPVEAAHRFVGTTKP